MLPIKIISLILYQTEPKSEEDSVNSISRLAEGRLKDRLQEKLKNWGQTSAGNCVILLQVITFYEHSKEEISFEILDRFYYRGDSGGSQLGAAAVRCPVHHLGGHGVPLRDPDGHGLSGCLDSTVGFLPVAGGRCGGCGGAHRHGGADDHHALESGALGRLGAGPVQPGLSAAYPGFRPQLLCRGPGRRHPAGKAPL